MNRKEGKAMIILLQTYCGLSDFTFEPSCTGRKLEEQELREKGFLSDKILRLNADSSYVTDWYEVKEGDQIRIQRRDDDGQIDETFIVPINLPDPPQRLDDHQRTGMHVYDYLVSHCRQV